MSKDEFYKIMQEVHAAYGEKKFPLSKETLDVWFKYLGKCNFRDLAEALERYIKEEAFPPTISSILGLYREIRWDRSRSVLEIYREIINLYPTGYDCQRTREAFNALISKGNPLETARQALNGVKELVEEWENSGRDEKDIRVLIVFFEVLVL